MAETVKISILDGVALVSGQGIILKDEQSALDIIADTSYKTGSNLIALYKENVAEDCFKLSSGLLGAILQKFVNYRVKLAIIGDFSKYSSKPLKGFIFESNKGGHIYFVKDEKEAVKKLKNER